MTRHRAWLFGGLALLTLLFGWVLVIVLPGWIAPRQSTAGPATITAEPAAPERKIKARLFFVVRGRRRADRRRA